MLEQLKNIGIASEIIAAVAATIYYSKYKNTSITYLLVLLWFIPINEILSQFFFARTSTGYILRNLYLVLVPLTLLFVTYKELKTKKNKIILIILIISCIVMYLTNLFWANPTSNFLSIGFTVASICTVIGLLCYLIEFLQTDQKINVGRDLYLWISVGFLIFFIAYPVIFFSRKFLTGDNYSLLNSINVIQVVLAIASYLTIAFGFYWGEKRVEKNNV